MDIHTLEDPASRAGFPSAWRAEPGLRLRALSLDIHLLERQMVLTLTADDRAKTGAGGADALALMAACCICERLAEGHWLLRQTGIGMDGLEALRAALDGARDGERAAAASDPQRGGAFLRDADLVRGLGLQQIGRLRALDSVAARMAEQVMAAASVFRAAVERAGAPASQTPATARRIEPAFSWSEFSDAELAQAPGAMARIA
ncbi:MAG TPA: hypothetical protein VL358_11710 [Caulobacteraceae bacterium]|jgi:hypothetical protein|nr:hypothetical protein [Caulobacteraceae bacterium]